MKTLKLLVILLITMNFIQCPSDDPVTEEIQGCTDPNSCNFNPDATENDGSCEYITCAGCMDQTACNYDPNATIDDGSCDFTSCAGCTDSTARNYDASATIDDGSCIYDCTLRGVNLEFFVVNVPADNVNARLEVLVNNVSAVRTVNKIFTSGNTLIFNQSDFDFNINGSLNIVDFSSTDMTMTVRLYIDDAIVDEFDYSTCYIEGNVNIAGNIVPTNYFTGGPGCGNGGCTYNAGLRFESVEF